MLFGDIFDIISYTAKVLCVSKLWYAVIWCNPKFILDLVKLYYDLNIYILFYKKNRNRLIYNRLRFLFQMLKFSFLMWILSFLWLAWVHNQLSLHSDTQRHLCNSKYFGNFFTQILQFRHSTNKLTFGGYKILFYFCTRQVALAGSIRTLLACWNKCWYNAIPSVGATQPWGFLFPIP